MRAHFVPPLILVYELFLLFLKLLNLFAGGNGGCCTVIVGNEVVHFWVPIVSPSLKRVAAVDRMELIMLDGLLDNRFLLLLEPLNLEWGRPWGHSFVCH